MGAQCAKSQVSFETTLRNYRAKDAENVKRELSFWKFAKKDRKGEFLWFFRRKPRFFLRIPLVSAAFEGRAGSQKQGDSEQFCRILGKTFGFVKYLIISANFLNIFFVSEGRLHYPKYDVRLPQRNINDFLHLVEKDVEKGTLEWELGLRPLKPVKNVKNL